MCKPEDHLVGEHRKQFFELLVNVDLVLQPFTSRIRPCHRISPGDELVLVRRLLDRRMCVLVPVSLVPTNSVGEPLRGGCFV